MQSNHCQLILEADPWQVRLGTPEMCTERFSDPYRLYCTAMSVSCSSAALSALSSVDPEFLSCSSLPGCEDVAWSKSIVSHRVRKIHRRVTKLTRDVFCHFSTEPCSRSVYLLSLLGCCGRLWVIASSIEELFLPHKQLILNTSEILLC